MTRHRILTAFVGLALTLTAVLHGTDAQAEQKIAMVDLQRAVSSTEDGLRAQATLKKLFDSKQQELNKKQNDLLKQREEIEKQAKVLAKDALEKRFGDWQKEADQLRQIFVEYNKELEKKQNELTEPVFAKMTQIIKRLATSENIDLVMDKPAVAYVRGDLDLTDRCIQMYNSNAGGAVAPAPAAPAAPAPKK